MAGVGASGRGAVAAYAARRLSCPFSMGLRPRLSAAAADEWARYLAQGTGEDSEPS